MRVLTGCLVELKRNIKKTERKRVVTRRGCERGERKCKMREREGAKKRDTTIFPFSSHCYATGLYHRTVSALKDSVNDRRDSLKFRPAP